MRDQRRRVSCVRAWLLAPAGLMWIASGVVARAQDAASDYDAVVLRHAQSWELKDDGTLVYDDHRAVKLLHSRAWRRYADPRVDFLEGAETVELITGITHLPDGTTIEIPEYSINEVSPSSTARWPVTAGWRQMVYTFSGVQNSAVLELHTRRTSKPGTRRWLSEQIRMANEDPVMERYFQISVPKDRPVTISLSGMAPQAVDTDDDDDTGRRTHKWAFTRIVPQPDEPRSVPWQKRCPRFSFTECPSGAVWVGELTAAIEAAAKDADEIAAFAAEAAKDEIDGAARVRAVAQKLKDTFRTVDDWRGWIGRNVRPAAETFNSHHGTLLESAAVTLAAMRGLGIVAAQPMIAVERLTFGEDRPMDADLSAVVIEVATHDGPVYVEVGGGIVSRNLEPWRHRDLLWADGEDLGVMSWDRKDDQYDSAHVRLHVKAGDDGKTLGGSATVELTGLFVDAEGLRTEDAKKKRVSDLLGQVIENVQAAGVSVSHLSEERFVAEANLEQKEAPESLDKGTLLRLAEYTPAMAAAGLPLDRSLRETAVRLPGRLRGRIDLTVELPKGWSAAITPAGVDVADKAWGQCMQSVEIDEDRLHMQREVRFDVDTIEADAYGELRRAVNGLRSDAFRMILLEKNGS